MPLLCVLQAFFSGTAKMCVRELRSTEAPNVVVFYLAFISSLGALIGTIVQVCPSARPAPQRDTCLAASAHCWTSSARLRAVPSVPRMAQVLSPMSAHAPFSAPCSRTGTAHGPFWNQTRGRALTLSSDVPESHLRLF